MDRSVLIRNFAFQQSVRKMKEKTSKENENLQYEDEMERYLKKKEIQNDILKKIIRKINSDEKKSKK